MKLHKNSGDPLGGFRAIQRHALLIYHKQVTNNTCQIYRQDVAKL